MAKHKSTSADTVVTIEPPRFDRPEVEIRASSRRKKTGTAHWSGSRIVVQIPARIRGRERAEERLRGRRGLLAGRRAGQLHRRSIGKRLIGAAMFDHRAVRRDLPLRRN